jgi:hypothetical protein
VQQVVQFLVARIRGRDVHLDADLAVASRYVVEGEEALDVDVRGAQKEDDFEGTETGTGSELVASPAGRAIAAGGRAF